MSKMVANLNSRTQTIVRNGKVYKIGDIDCQMAAEEIERLRDALAWIRDNACDEDSSLVAKCALELNR